MVARWTWSQCGEVGGQHVLMSMAVSDERQTVPTNSTLSRKQCRTMAITSTTPKV